MKRTCFILPIILLCSSVAMAQFQWLHATAKRMYNGTTLVLADSALLDYSGSWPTLLPQTGKWNYDSAWHYNGAGNQVKREGRNFNSNSEISVILEETYTGSNWAPLGFWRYEYDMNGFIENIVWYDWGGAPDSMRTHYTRTMQGLVTEKLEQNWDAANSQWVDAVRYTYTYNLGKNEIMMLREDWDIANSQWVNFMRIASTWNGSQKTEQLTARYIAGNWENDIKNVYTYDVNNDLTGDESSSWNGTGWDKSINTTYSYVTPGLVAEEIHQSWDGTQYINLYEYAHEYDTPHAVMITRKMTWDINTTAFVYKTGDDENREYYQGESAVRNVAGKATAIQVYPIPAKNNLRIQANVNNSYTAKIYMVDMNGRQVKSQFVPAVNNAVDAFIDITGLPAGIYTLTLEAGSSTANRKVVVE